MSLEDLFKSEDFFWMVVLFVIVVVICFVIERISHNAKVSRSSGDDTNIFSTIAAKIISKELSADMLQSRIIFEFADGSRVCLVVDESRASTWMVGDEGTLSYKGNSLIKFERKM